MQSSYIRSALGVALVATMAASLSVAGAEANKPIRKGELDFLREGVKAWTASIEAIEGNATCSKWFSDFAVMRQAAIVAQVQKAHPGYHADTPFFPHRRHGVYRFRFAADQEHWWQETRIVQRGGCLDPAGIRGRNDPRADPAHLWCVEGSDTSRKWHYDASWDAFQLQNQERLPFEDFLSALVANHLMLSSGEMILYKVMFAPAEGSHHRFLDLGDQRVNGRLCRVLRKEYETRNFEGVATYWIAVDNGFVPMRRESVSLVKNGQGHIIPGRGFRHVYEVSKIKEVDGVWLPVESTMSDWYYHPDRKGEDAWLQTTTVEYDGLHVNRVIDPERFKFHIPLGAWVMNAIEGRNYHEGGTDEAGKKWRNREAPKFPARFRTLELPQ